MASASTRVTWPHAKTFAFTVFDDPDAQTTSVGREVYAFLLDLGFQTTKGVWPLHGNGPRSCNGECCEDPAYLEWCLEIQQHGVEIGYHNASQNSADRELTLRGLDRFRELFGADPVTMSNHYNSEEGIYWGDRRLTGSRRFLYNLATRYTNRERFFGEIEGHPLFWGDYCRDRIRYVRNFVFQDINTLRACPRMPYFDADRPLVSTWYASSEGSDRDRFVRMISEENQDRLIEEGGACIMYTHFGHGFVVDGKIDPRFRKLMTRLSKQAGWFTPVGPLLGHLQSAQGVHQLTASERADLEWRWLLSKIRHGTS